MNVVETYIGKGLLDEYAETTENYKQYSVRNDLDESKRKKVKEDLWKQFTTYVFVKNSDQMKYGTLLQGWETQFSMDHDQYPKTMEAAKPILYQHQFNRRAAKSNKFRTERTDTQRILLLLW